VAAAIVRYCTHSLCRRHGWMVLSDMVCGCVRGCVEELWYNYFFVSCAYLEGGRVGSGGKKYLN